MKAAGVTAARVWTATAAEMRAGLAMLYSARWPHVVAGRLGPCDQVDEALVAYAIAVQRLPKAELAIRVALAMRTELGRSMADATDAELLVWGLAWQGYRRMLEIAELAAIARHQQLLATEHAAWMAGAS